MLKRLIENWLNSISEREFDFPFRLLLEAEGHTAIGRSTIHGAMELGKDIVSWKENEGIYYFFQLKAGDADLSSWNEMERQIRQLVEVPYVHPNYSVGDPYQPVWVCTGQLDEAVRLTLGLKNEELRRNGKPIIELWDRNKLIDKYVNKFFDVVFVDDYFTVDFIRVWSHATDYLTDEKSLQEFLTDYLKTYPKTGKRKIKRFYATYALILSQIGQRYMNLDNLYSAIDLLMLGLVCFFEHITSEKVASKLYIDSLEIVEEQLSNYLARLLELCCISEEQIKDLCDYTGGLSEIFELPLRVHSLASKLSLAILFQAKWHSSFENELLSNVIRNNLPAFCNIITEKQMGTFWLTIVALLKTDNHVLAKECIINANHG